MPSLSSDSPTGQLPFVTSVLVLRLDPGRLEIGFGTVPLSNQASIKARFESGPALRFSVEFPQSGETRTYALSLMDEPTAEQLRAFSFDLLTPFEFSGLSYDPLGSIAASVSRLATPAAGKSGGSSDRPADRPGSPADGIRMPGDGTDKPGQPNGGLMALWAAVEADLYRFAKDPGFTAAVDTAAMEQPGEYRRFARLNDLYRDIVTLLVPYGLAPRRWTAWLKGLEYRPLLSGSLALRIEEFQAGRAGQPERAMDTLTTLLVEYGAFVMRPTP